MVRSGGVRSLIPRKDPPHPNVARFALIPDIVMGAAAAAQADPRLAHLRSGGAGLAMEWLAKAVGWTT